MHRFYSMYIYLNWFFIGFLNASTTGLFTNNCEIMSIPIQTNIIPMDLTLLRNISIKNGVHYNFEPMITSKKNEQARLKLKIQLSGNSDAKIHSKISFIENKHLKFIWRSARLDSINGTAESNVDFIFDMDHGVKSTTTNCAN